MYQPPLSPPHRINKKFARALLPLLVWLAVAVALSLKYGKYGNYRLVLGSNSSRMVKTSSIFVKEIKAKGIPANKGLFIYGFSNKPKLGLATNRSTRYSMFLDSYGHKKLSMWLNKGSNISINWNLVVHGGASNGELLLVLIKGSDHHNLKGLNRYDHLRSHGLNDNKMMYVIKEDNTYSIEIINLNPQSIQMDLYVNVSSTMYDTTKATSFCSLTNTTTCKLKLDFPRYHYFVFTTPSNEDHNEELELVLAFTGRIITYFFLLGLIMAIIWIIIEQLQSCQPTERAQEEVMENEPILATKEVTCNYGTSEDPETSLSGSFTDTYDEKICILCYEQNKACFFTPCGHSISCFSCAQRIMKEENKICPVCRRLIQKIRKLPGL
ncbi:putative E3 ubiquitin ligase protein [Dioscorea alata]|uniref:E3 ubiquitin ligase protein n=1 Tax=Dioscorea alata TaxID=55571 RepID=A0ACB7UK07_DIOAL|nr:putative E3 ubiquitin ligase protein [Dioscorea alata]